MDDASLEELIEIYTMYTEDLDDEEDVLYELTHSARFEDNLLVIRVGLTSQVASSSGIYCASAEGLATLFDTVSGMVLYQSDVIRSNAFSEDPEQAVTDAFKVLVDIAYTLIKAEYV